jgi:hypothetical protein
MNDERAKRHRFGTILKILRIQFAREQLYNNYWMDGLFAVQSLLSVEESGH